MKVRKIVGRNIAYYVNCENSHFATMTAPLVKQSETFPIFAERKAAKFCSAMRKVVKVTANNLIKKPGTKELIDKPAMCKKYGLAGREFNLALDVGQAMVGSAIECQEIHRQLLSDKLDNAIYHYTVAECENEAKWLLKGRQRRIESLQRQLDKASGPPRVFALGGTVYRAQHEWEDKAMWKEEYVKARNSTFGARGSSDELGGNSTYRLHYEECEPRSRIISGKQEVYQVYKFRVEHTGDALGHFYLPEKEGRSLADMLASNNKPFKGKKKKKTASAKRKKPKRVAGRTPIKVFFMRQGNNWTVHLAFPATGIPVPKKANGAIAIDLNSGHLEASAVRLVNKKLVVDEYRTFSYDKDTDSNTRERQLYATVREIVGWARQRGDRIVMEYLDFEGCKRLMRNKLGALLHVLPYRKILQKFERECFLQGVEIRYVRASYTSLLGNLIASMHTGMSRDVAASVVIGLRGLEGGNSYLTKICRQFLSAKKFSLRVNDKGKYGRHVIVMNSEDKGKRGVADPENDTEVSVIKKRETPSVYGVQARAGDTINDIAKALRKERFSENSRIECRVLRKEGVSQEITFHGLPKSARTKSGRLCGKAPMINFDQDR